MSRLGAADARAGSAGRFPRQRPLGAGPSLRAQSRRGPPGGRATRERGRRGSDRRVASPGAGSPPSPRAEWNHLNWRSNAYPAPSRPPKDRPTGKRCRGNRHRYRGGARDRAPRDQTPRGRAGPVTRRARAPPSRGGEIRRGVRRAGSPGGLTDALASFPPARRPPSSPLPPAGRSGAGRAAGTPSGSRPPRWAHGAWQGRGRGARESGASDGHLLEGLLGGPGPSASRPCGLGRPSTRRPGAAGRRRGFSPPEGRAVYVG